MHSSQNLSKSVYYAYWALAAICLWNLNGVTAIAFGMTRLLSAIILLTGLVVLAKARESWIDSLGRPGIWFVSSIVVYLSLGSVIHFESSVFISHINSIFVVLVGAVGAAYLAPRIGLNKFITIVTILACLGALTVYLSPFLWPLYRRMEMTERLMNVGRWMGFFANPNETGMAGVYALSACLALSSLKKKESMMRRLLPIIIAALGIGVFLSFSRGAMIAFAVVGCAYVLIAVELTAQSIKAVIAAIVFAAGSYFFFTQGYKSMSWTPEQFNRIKSVERILTLEKTSSRDVGGRTSGMKAGLAYWQKAPIFGHGLGTLHKMPTRYLRGLGCHNTHVMVLGEVGVFGFLFYFGFWVSLALASYKHPNVVIRQFCLMISLSMLLNGMVGHNLLSNRNSNLLLGMLLGLASLPMSVWETDNYLEHESLQGVKPELA